MAERARVITDDEADSDSFHSIRSSSSSSSGSSDLWDGEEGELHGLHLNKMPVASSVRRDARERKRSARTKLEQTLFFSGRPTCSWASGCLCLAFLAALAFIFRGGANLETGAQHLASLPPQALSTEVIRLDRNKLPGDPTARTSYIVSIDAGSTGSRVFLFKVSVSPQDEAFSHEYPWALDMIQSFKNDDPLASAMRPGDTLSPLIERVKTWLKTIPKGPVRPSDVPVYLGATAGMRTLPPSKVSSIMNAVDAYLMRCGLVFRPGFARVLSGEEEGAFGWQAVQYLLARHPGRFQGTGFGHGVGALDLGGASTQITGESQSILESLFVMDTAPFRSERVYSKSFLYFGGNEYQAQLESYLCKNKNESAYVNSSSPCTRTVKHPCWPSGFSRQIKNVCLEGSSDPAKCDALNGRFLRQFLSPSVPCLQAAKQAESCTLQGRYIPKALRTKAYMAFSGYFYRWQFFTAPSAVASTTQSLSSSLQELIDSAQKVCALNNSALEDYAKRRKADSKYTIEQCALAYYIKHLLLDAFHLKMDTPIFAVDAINGTSVNWALGLVLYENFRLKVDDLFRQNAKKSGSYLRNRLFALLA